MSETITLTMTREHAQIVQNACEMLMRLKLGQTGYAVDTLIGFPKPDRDMDMHEYCLRRDMANDILKTALRVLLGDNKYGLPDGKKDDAEALAYEIWGTLRHALYMHDGGDYDSYDVRSREPMSESGLRCRYAEWRGERMKPILFNTEMVRAILDGRKTQTRRLVKNIPLQEPYFEVVDGTPYACDGNGEWHPAVEFSQIQEGDVLYVRETWWKGVNGQYCYLADYALPDITRKQLGDGHKARPSIHMPKEAARLFLRVTGVRCERLQNITPHDALREGVKDPYDYQPSSWYDRHNGLLNSAEVAAFAGLLDTTVKSSELEKYGWDANPWVWVIEFERIDKP